MKNSIKPFAMGLIAFFSFFFTTFAQTPALDAAFQTKEASLQTVADSATFSPVPYVLYPDFATQFEAKFMAQWSAYEKEVLKKIENATTKKQLQLIQTTTKTEFKTIVLVVFYELLEKADEVYKKNLSSAQKTNLSFDEKNQLATELAAVKKTITQLKQQKLYEVK